MDFGDRARYGWFVPQVAFTQNLQRHVACERITVAGDTLREALDAVFAVYPRLRGYVLDDQGAVRRHMTVFLDGTQIRDRISLADPVTENSEIYIMQALSGG